MFFAPTPSPRRRAPGVAAFVANSTVASFTADLGTGSPIYVVLVIGQVNASTTTDPTNPTNVKVGGVSLTNLASFNDGGVFGVQISFWGGYAPAGGNQTISFTPNASATSFPVAVYTLKNSPNVGLTSSGGGTSASLSLQVAAGGVIIAGAAGGGSSVTFTGVTRDGLILLPATEHFAFGHNVSITANNAYAVSRTGGSFETLAAIALHF